MFIFFLFIYFVLLFYSANKFIAWRSCEFSSESREIFVSQNVSIFPSVPSRRISMANFPNEARLFLSLRIYPSLRSRTVEPSSVTSPREKFATFHSWTSFNPSSSGFRWRRAARIRNGKRERRAILNPVDARDDVGARYLFRGKLSPRSEDR